MRGITKKISSSIFILLGFTPLLLSLFYTLKQQSIRHRMKHRMEEQLLHSIILADNEIHWLKEGKEIWVHGKMFDIKSAEHKNGITIFHGLFDDDETALKKNFNESWKKNMTRQNQLLAQLFQSLKGIYFQQTTDIFLKPNEQHHWVSLFPPRVLSQFLAIPTPPPQT